MTMPLVLLGGGGHASDLLNVVEQLQVSSPDAGYAIFGILADQDPDMGRFAGRDLGQGFLGPISELASLPVDVRYLIAVGYSAPRQSIFKRISHFPHLPGRLVHPRCDLGTGASVGEGSVVFGGAEVSPLARIGNHCYVSQNASVGHDAVLGDFTTLLPGAVVSGDTRLGCQVLVGSNAVLTEGLTVGDGATISAGSVVLRDVPQGVTVMGNPARTQPRIC